MSLCKIRIDRKEVLEVDLNFKDCFKYYDEELLKCLKALEEDGKGYYKVLFKGCDWFAEIHITHLDIPAEELILKL